MWCQPGALKRRKGAPTDRCLDERIAAIAALPRRGRGRITMRSLTTRNDFTEPTERAVQRHIRALLPVVLSGRRRMSVESWVPADVLNRGANSCPGCVDLAHCNRNVTRLARPRFRTTRTLSPSAIHPCHRVRSTLVLVAVTRQSRRARPPLVTGVLVHLYRAVATCGHAHSNPR